MKCIGFLSRWNATCGVSLHAELIGREFIKDGINIKVFAPYLDSANKWWHHISTMPDESFVIRCFNETDPNGKEGNIEIERVLKEKIDGLIVESWASLPKKATEELVLEMNKRGIPTIAIIHEGFEKDLGYNNMNIFKKVVIFHEGYKEILKGKVDEEKIEVVHYPCIPPVVKRNRRFSEDGKIVFFSFGRQPKSEYEDYLKVLNKISKNYSICYRVIRSSELLPYNYEWLEQKKQILSIDRIYENLKNADIHLVPKGNTEGKVVSSTFCQTVGSLAIHVAPDTAHFEDEKKEKEPPVLLYSDVQDLENKLIRIIEKPLFRKRIIKSAHRYAQKNSASVIAMKILLLLDPVFIKDIKHVVNF